VFLLDCGRKMHARDETLSHFDHALDAVLLLATSRCAGDAVGLLAFSGASRWLAPRGAGNERVELVATSRAARARHFWKPRSSRGRLAKRARGGGLEPAARTTKSSCFAARRRPSPRLVASMKERALSQALESRVKDLDSALTLSATHQYLQARRRAHERLRKSGVLALDAEPQQLAVALVNGYLDVKASGIL
jgi:uncharacterized protein (DUF58 family)